MNASAELRQTNAVAQAIELPTYSIPEVIAWSPDCNHLAVACRSLGIVILPEGRLLFPMKKSDSPARFDQMSWSLDGKELGILFSKSIDKCDSQSNQLWRVPLSGAKPRLVNTNVASFGWAKKLIYIKDYRNKKFQQFPYLSADDGNTGQISTVERPRGFKSRVWMPIRGCFPTALSPDAKCFMARMRDSQGTLGKGILRVGRIDPVRRRLLWHIDIKPSWSGQIAEHTSYDRIVWNEDSQAAAISASGGTDGGLGRYLILVSRHNYRGLAPVAGNVTELISSLQVTGKYFLVAQSYDRGSVREYFQSSLIAYDGNRPHRIVIQNLPEALVDRPGDMITDTLLAVGNDSKHFAHVARDPVCKTEKTWKWAVLTSILEEGKSTTKAAGISQKGTTAPLKSASPVGPGNSR